MAEQYLELGPGDRRDVLAFAASESGRPAYLLEKDVWVVWALRTLFDAPMGAPLVFRGGTRPFPRRTEPSGAFPRMSI